MKFLLTPYNLQELGQRQNQEDALFPGLGKSTLNDRLFILCDGMGGHEHGEVASNTVCDAMSSFILQKWNPSMPLSDMLLKDALNHAFDALDAKDSEGAKKMGTTMTFLCLHANGVTVAHIGDSRVYQLRPAKNGKPAQIVFRTKDHSLVNDLIAVGEITEEEALTHPQKNVITRAMQPGQQPRVNAEIKHLTDIQDGDYFYMCSDGMLEQTSDDNLLFIVTKPNVTDEEKMKMLRDVSEDNSDNHTAHLIKVEKVIGANTAQPPAYNKPTQAKGRLIETFNDKDAANKPSNMFSAKMKYILMAVCAVLLLSLVFIVIKCNSPKKEAIDTEETEIVEKEEKAINQERATNQEKATNQERATNQEDKNTNFLLTDTTKQKQQKNINPFFNRK